MNILLINSLDKRYGSTYRARNIRDSLEALGHVCIYVESNCQLQGSSIISIPQNDNVVSYLIASVKRALAVLRTDYDIAIIQKMTPLTVLAIIAAAFKKRPSLIDWDYLDSYFQSNIIRKMLTAFTEAISPGFAKAFTTHSALISEIARNRYKKEVFYLPQTADVEMFDPDKFDASQIKSSLGLSGKLVLGYAGTLTQGGMRDMETMLGFVKDNFSEGQYYFLLAGGGPLLEKAKAMFDKFSIRDFLITGMVAHEKMAYYISAMDICFIFMKDDPGDKARVSLKLLEYLSMKKPVVGKVFGETKNILGRYVFDVDGFKGPGSLEAVWDCHDRSGARDLIISRYSPCAFNDAVRNILDEVAGGNN